MANKTLSATERIKALTEGKKVSIPKIQRTKKSKDGSEPKIDRRHFNKRTPGSGRKPGGVAAYKRAMKEYLAKYFSEPQKVQAVDPKSGKTIMIEKPKVVVMVDLLYQVALMQRKGDAHAADLWLSRALGRPAQPHIGDEEEDPIQIDLGIERILKKVYGADEN